MTNLTIKYIVQHIAQLFGKQADMAIEQFNNLLAMANDELFKEFAGGYQTGNGAEVDARVEAALRPFKVVRTFPLYTQSTDLGAQSHRLDVNASDYIYLSAWDYNSVNGVDTTVKVDVITPSELSDRLSNSITMPTDSYPVLVISSNATGLNKYAYHIPRTSPIPNLHVLALRRPSTPSLVLTYANGVESQSGSSLALEWDAMFHVDIVRKILQYLGLVVGNQLI